MENNIESLISKTISNLKEVLDIDSIIGSPIKITEKVTIVPICKITMGLISGGCDVGKDRIKKARIDNYTGASGTGINYTPVGVLSIVGDVVKFIPLGNNVPYYNIVNSLEKTISKILDKIGDENEDNKE